MKTPMQTARYTFDKMHSRAAKACENEILYMIESAIGSDREQARTQLLVDPVVDAEVVVPDVDVDTWFSEDATPVVQIDTRRGLGRLRINLNDGVVWDGDPETDERPGSYAEPDEFAELEAEVARLNGALDVVRELHFPVDVEPSETICNECSYCLPNGRYLGKVTEWPCPTVVALDNPYQKKEQDNASE